MERLSIGEVARRAGINASAIRYYERAGLLAEPERVGGKRCYDPEVIQRLRLIDAAKRTGLTIKETYTLIYGFPVGAAASERWQLLASSKLEEVEKLMAQLGQMRDLLAEALRCECVSLDECARLLSKSG
jgi:MerR family redox-sensitive transcriptional activator SoxR